MERSSGLWIVWLVIAVFVTILLVVLSPFTIVGAGERTVVTNLGQLDRTLGPGMHWVTPLTESTHDFNVQQQKEQASAKAASKDLQEVTTEITLNYHLNPDSVASLYVNVGDDVAAKIITPSLQESIKAATAKYTAEELITKRAEVSQVIEDNVKASIAQRLGGDYVVVDGIAITNFDFSPAFNQAIEAKVTAEQNALAAKNKLEQVKYEADQRLTQAKAEAEAIKIQAQAITSQGGADYVKLKTIEKWNGMGCTQYCGLDASTGLLISK